MSLIRKIWQSFFICTFVVSSIFSIQGIYQSRNLVAHLYDLKLMEEKLSRESTQLSLEESVLLRGTRLQHYASTKLNLQRAKVVRSLANKGRRNEK